MGPCPCGIVDLDRETQTAKIESMMQPGTLGSARSGRGKAKPPTVEGSPSKSISMRKGLECKN